jgi:myo-inositol 2-dehydrogenase/D-chiro-inositol 1-dehydrogenase
VTLRIGIAGLGRIGALHARNLAESGLVSGLIVNDSNANRARGVADELGAQCAPSLDSLLDGGIDGLVVATPTDSHAHLVSEAIRRDVPVFCEKPLADSLEGGFAVAALAAQRRVPLQVGLQRRSDSQLAQLRARLKTAVDCRLIGLRVVSSSWRPPSAEYLRASGGFFRDKLVHDVDVVRWISGREIELAAVVGSGAATGWIGDTGDVDTVAASLVLTGGVIAQIWAARMSPTRFEFRVDAITEREALSAGGWTDDESSGTVGSDGPFATFVARFSEAYRAEMRSFCELVGGNGQNACTAMDAMASEVATDALERAWRERCVVGLAGRDTGGAGVLD